LIYSGIRNNTGRQVAGGQVGIDNIAAASMALVCIKPFNSTLLYFTQDSECANNNKSTYTSALLLRSFFNIIKETSTDDIFPPYIIIK
jgi:hypothetical protein